MMAMSDIANVDELMQLAAFGGGFSLDATVISVEDIKKIVAHAAKGNARLEIKNSSQLNFQELKAIASFGKGNVFFA